MDNSWQMKCSSSWPSLTPSISSSSQLQPQEPRNQMWNAGHYFYPHVTQEPSPAARGILQEATVPKTSNLCSSNSGHADLGNSFLSLLSAPPSLMQCDLQQYSNPKPLASSSKVPVSGNSFTIGAAGSGVSIVPAGIFSQNLNIQNPKTGADFGAVASSRAVENANYGSGYSLLDVLQAANFNHQSSESAKPGFFYSKWGWFSNLSLANAGKLHGNSTQASQNTLLETNSSISRRSSTLTSGCPRVFCLSASGNLLLSNTGLLGVVCLCHGLHMSIAKFSEHSGLRDVNPGDAVHMDSGETIARWRKLYFQKFGIRVPEDHNGWDWPEGFSTTAGMVKCSAKASNNMSKKSDLCNLAGSSGGLTGFGQPQNNGAFLKKPNTVPKLVDEVSFNGKQRSDQDSHNFLCKGLIGSSQSNLPTIANNQFMACPLSGCSTMSKFVGVRDPDNGCHSISAYIDSITKSGQSFISHQNLQNSKSSGNDSDSSRLFNLKDGNVVDRDTVSSSFELRLGQPSPQSQTLGNPVLPAFRSHLFDKCGDPPKSFLPEQLIHKSNSMVVEEHSQHLQHAALSSISSGRRGQSQSLVLSMLLSQFKTPTDGRMQSKAASGVVDGNHVMTATPHCESHIAKYDPTNFLRTRGNAIETPLNINKMDLQKHVDKGKEVAFVAGGLRIATEPNYEFHTKHMECSTNCNGVGRTGHHSCLVAHDKSSHPYLLSGVPPDACNARNPFNNSGKIPCLGFNRHLDHVFLGSMSLPMDSGPTLPLQAVSVGSPVTTSTSVLNTSPALSNKECSGISPYLVDENLRMLALRHINKLSNQGHANASHGTKQDQGRLDNSCGEKIQGSITDPSASKEQRHGLAVSSKQVASEVGVKSLQSGFSWMVSDAQTLAPASAWALCYWTMDCSCTSGRIDNDITPPNEHGKCCQRVPYTYFPGECGCTVQTNCQGNHNSNGETFNGASKERTGNGMPSMFFDPKFKEKSTFPKEKAISFDQSGNLEGQVKKKVDSHDFQWRDVPSKVTRTCNVACKDRPADLLDKRGNIRDHVANAPTKCFNRSSQIADAATKCFDRSAQDAEFSKEHEVSNISSGCSAPAVTQASVEFNDLDYSTVEAGDKCTQNLVVDEGSVIDKCWSSDDPPDSESSEFFGFACKFNSANEGSSKPLPNQSSRSLIDELRLRDSLILKNVRNQSLTGLSILEKRNHIQNFEKGFKSAKSKRPTKWKMLNASFPASGFPSVHEESRKCIGSSALWHSRSSKDEPMWLQPDQGRPHNCACSVGPNFKQKSVLCSTKIISRKRAFQRFHNNREGENYRIQLNVDDDRLEVPENSSRKRFRLDQTFPSTKLFQMREPHHTDTGIVAKSNSADCMIISSTEQVGICEEKVRPIVCGKYGVISNGNSSRPVKFVPLRKILKATRRCTLAENKLKLTSVKKSKKRNIRRSNECIDKFSDFKERDNEGYDDTVRKEFDPDSSMKETETHFPGCKELDDVPHTLEKETDDGSEKDHRILDSSVSTRLKPKCKEVRKRSLYELSIEGKDSICVDTPALKGSKCVPQTKCRYLAKFLKNADDGKHNVGGTYSAKSTEMHQCQSSISDLDAFCCVCGSSNNDEINCLLDCGRCLIRVHQACYGVSKVPRGRWYCRPCRTSSKNIVCVLCGYGGGAMTRALYSRNIVKSLLKAWNIVTESGPKDVISLSEVLEDRLSMLSTSTSGHETDSFPVIRPVPIQPCAVLKMDLQKQLDSVKSSPHSSSNLKVNNSITAGVLDSTVKQWVHMVCGLWTPGTRCPNVDTMSAFDVSGASCPKANAICSLCNRSGGCCIQCRVRDCSVPFHPWCAHQKGLLQSEVEGVDDESVGFYGRCALHATYFQCDSDGDPIGTETGHPGDKEYTCARTEKAYAHYRQSKGWKHLVVYKSGIHALGLYTSQFISRGAMVVEYVGEIVGLRVADKRENEYQFGRKLQYKSACYFFRIDKEHIIDATHKGGIARFVNHSCLPNCVAKVISVRSEKKVVFFAERDIYPGEEITYDYHFNHEDEGKKIPCFVIPKIAGVI
ncbi:Histone-lysine N-methyltransferase trr [Camellia lanceoleosa]|uniref:Histone-lysine N-methyltransferase trr n=1 Tax=Camellia lanceoleosa TaxID=1840588 RepID=A0ACC0FYT3_9ERIC|nr:Histone-lysine N-methyltransferase trr [Camellia lanceoleosa]